MAQLIDHVVEWDGAAAAAKAGSLNEYLFPDEDEDGDENSELDEISLSDFTRNENYSTYFSVGEAYAAIRQGLPPAQVSATDRWFFRIFGQAAGAGEWQADSPELFKNDVFHTSFSPTTIIELAGLGSQISFESLKNLFLEKCPPDVLTELNEDAEFFGSPGLPFEGAFLPYVRGWNEFLQQLAGSGKGVLIYIG